MDGPDFTKVGRRLLPYPFFKNLNVANLRVFDLTAYASKRVSWFGKQTPLYTVSRINTRRLFLGAFAKLRKAILSLVVSVCPPVRPSVSNNLAPTRRLFMKFDV